MPSTSRLAMKALTLDELVIIKWKEHSIMTLSQQKDE